MDDNITCSPVESAAYNWCKCKRGDSTRAITDDDGDDVL